MNKKFIITTFMELEMTTQLYHWTTTKYSRHIGSDKLFKNLLETIDKFIEVYIGIYSRNDKKLLASNDSITVKKLNDDDFIKYLSKIKKFLSTDLIKILSPSDTDLFNIRDELLAHINQSLYLFSLE